MQLYLSQHRFYSFVTVVFGINTISLPSTLRAWFILFPATFSVAVTQQRAEEGGIIQDSLSQSDRECNSVLIVEGYSTCLSDIWYSQQTSFVIWSCYLYTSSPPRISRNQTHPTRTTEVHVCWQKSGEHFRGSRNQVCPVWNFPASWQYWSKGQEHGPQKLKWSRTNQHSNPPGMADWKRQAASDVGNTNWGLAWCQTFHSC